MVAWWMVPLALVLGGSFAVLLHGLVIAASQPTPPISGLWRGRVSGTEFWIDRDDTAWIREAPRAGDPHRMVELAVRCHE